MYLVILIIILLGLIYDIILGISIKKDLNRCISIKKDLNRLLNKQLDSVVVTEDALEDFRTKRGLFTNRPNKH
jgi:hypothetical protein